MKYFTVASALFVAAAVAQPHGNHHRRHHEHDKRALYTKTEWVTETQYVTELVDSTTTVWIGYETTSTEEAKFVETSHSVSSSSSSSTSTSEAYTEPETTTSSSSSVYVAPTTSSSSSVYVAPPQSSTTKEEEKSTYVAPVPTTTSVYVAPSSTYVAPVATTSASSDSDSGSGSGSGSGTTYSGEITYYTLGLGSCGEDDAGLDLSANTVAIAADMMGGTSYDTTYCGKTITIKANGNTCQGVIRDKCPGCSAGSIDVSEKIFTELWGGLDKGRGDVEWWFN